MSGPSARQRELMAASAAAASRTRRGIEEAASRPPAPGDVFVLPETADQPVEWLLLERPDPAGPFVAVPGDSHPFLGSADLDVETTAGRLSLRCRWRVRLDPERLDLRRRVATVEREELERVRKTMAELPQPPFSGLSLAEEADASPEYRRWLREVVEPARAAAEERGAVLPFPAPGPTARRSRSAPYAAVAAAAALLLVTGLGAWGLREKRRADRLAAQERTTLQALAAARLEQEAVNRSLGELRRQQQAEAGKLHRRIADLEKAVTAPAAPEPLLNLPVAILLPQETLRGETEAVRLPPGSPYLALVLRFREVPGFATFRVTLTPRGARDAVWSGEGLERTAQGAVHVALPRRLVPPGEHILRLYGLRGGRAETLAEYALQIR